jgi:alpha-D-ribose 1-methylphosphonate 5-triphosphate synthase subunit PhnH
MPATSFPEPVLASAVFFRAVMDAFARPGEIRAVSSALAPPSPLSATAAALAMVMLDYETPVWLDAALSQQPAVGDWIRLHTGARVTSEPGQAAFALIADPAGAPAFDTFSLGTPDYPDRSTTLVLQMQGFGRGEALSLSGPGIADVRSFSSEPLPSDFHSRLVANRALFPRGVDVILVSPDSVAALPRSVHVICPDPGGTGHVLERG